MDNDTKVIKMLTVKEAKQLKLNVMSYLTDKNVGFLPLEGTKEDFGALVALTYAFRKINECFMNELGV